MVDLKGRAVAITGAASGLGKEMARRCHKLGAKLALADIEASTLDAFAKELQEMGAEVFASAVDVSKYEDMQAFAAKTFASYSDVALFFNNAGVEISGSVWQASMNDWKWVYGVNVFGIIHGIKCFIPEMLKQDQESIIINTSSLAGLLSGHNSPIYLSGKHAVVTITESLELQLQQIHSKIKAFVFCPGYVKTRLHEAGRNRPAELSNGPDDPYYQTEDYKQKQGMMQYAVPHGIEVGQAIDMVFDAIEKDHFYIQTTPEAQPKIAQRCNNILENKRPVFVG
jgi:NADP-dependent 3-hydroxy acid dehydrogenase YdfG